MPKSHSLKKQTPKKEVAVITEKLEEAMSLPKPATFFPKSIWLWEMRKLLPTGWTTDLTEHMDVASGSEK